ncbi:putative toxin-antitoxin system toxin component, PIN family [Candidatus Woesearchaeota archaeon]|nr:putative toxin-antitoxin system toxin component, PIN family [Candidatus Woesearchaeota archaeon]
MAALLSETGGAAAVFEQIVQQRVFNFYTREIIEEVKSVLSREKFGLDREKQDHFLHIIQEVSYDIQQLQEFEIRLCRDPKDDKFLSLANQIDADFLVSLDDDLLVLKQIGKTKIITPGEYLSQANKA